jgi:S-ribosylhomocysteine lyase LuxS involved in autoinducer biosynthesis
MHVRNANARHARMSATWAPQRNARHVRKLGAQMQRKASSQDGRPNEKLIRNENVHTREHLAKRRAGGWIRTNFGLEVYFLIRPHPGWAPQRNERRVRKMGAQTQRKARPQDGRPNEKPIRNENVHTREH